MIKLITKWTILNDLSKKRLEVCEKCEFLEKDSYRCTKCGCFMWFKTKFLESKCPEGKWIDFKEES